MSTALTYREPYRFSAGLLALTVHLIFFFLLYSSFRWQERQPEAFMVDMWDSLPDMEVAPDQEPTPLPPTTAEQAPPPKVAAPVLPPVKADIEVRDKKKLKDEAAKKAATAARVKQEKERRELDEYVARRVQSEQARVRAEVDTATRVQVERYQDLIRNKIRRNIVPPPDVPESAKAEFKVTLLPSGDVMAVELLKSSGNAAYDNAAERAIYKAQPLPMPTENGLQKMFRELRLTIRP
jgi:colicin import membrane protein